MISRGPAEPTGPESVDPPEGKPSSTPARLFAQDRLHSARRRLALASRTKGASDNAVTSRLRTLLGHPPEVLDPAGKALRDELRSSVIVYARVLRQEGEPPERMLVLVKSAVQPEETRESVEENRALMEEVVRWSLEGYYGEPKPE
jgi:hypothetical protein